MYSISATNKFKKDYKKCKKRGLKISSIDELIRVLEKTGEVPAEYKPHKLRGNYKGCWECHIQPDWLMIWEKTEDIKLISLIRTGSHTDLF